MRTLYTMKQFITLLLVAIILLLILPKHGATYSEITPQTTPHDVLAMTPEAYAMVKYNDPLFWEIARCESGLNPNAKHPVSSASGVMQIINSTWNMYSPPNYDKFNFSHNVEVGWKIYKAESWKPWSSSINCWK